MMRIVSRLVMAAMLVCGIHATAWGGAAESDIKDRIAAGKGSDTAQGATALLSAMQECSARLAEAPKNPLQRRPFELLLRDAQDACAGLTSPAAHKVFATTLPRLAPEALASLCCGLRNTPASPEVDAAATKVLVPGMDFRSRAAIIDMLGSHHYAPAWEKIVKGLDPVAIPSVQIATCRALAAISEKKSIPELIKYMGALPAGKGGRFIHEATGALRTLTGQTIVAHAGEWKKWWEANAKTFGLDPAKTLTPDYNYELSEKQEIEYYEVAVVENRLVLVLDASGSMEMGGKPNRLESAKTEMKKFVKSLPDKTLFNIVVFSGTVRRWSKDIPLLAANEVNKKEALKFIDAQNAGGGTQTMLAMEEAIRNIALVNGCETIYLVTDGNPNPVGGFKPDQQERLITWINQTLKIRINTIGIYSLTAEDEKRMAAAKVQEDPETMKKFLYDLASNNDGVYREVGKDGANKVVKVDPKREKKMKEEEEKKKAEKEAKDKADKDMADKTAKEKAGANPDPLKPEAVKPDPIKPDDAKSKENPFDTPKNDKELEINKLLNNPDEKKSDDAKTKDKPVVEAPRTDKDIELKVEIKKPDDPKKADPKKDDAKAPKKPQTEE